MINPIIPVLNEESKSKRRAGSKKLDAVRCWRDHEFAAIVRYEVGFVRWWLWGPHRPGCVNGGLCMNRTEYICTPYMTCLLDIVAVEGEKVGTGEEIRRERSTDMKFDRGP